MTNRVYSTDKGSICPNCNEAVNQCCCASIKQQQHLANLDGIIRIRRETAGRKGKGVTILSGIALPEAELKVLLKQMKKICGSGGTLKKDMIEIQGEHREKLKTLLEKQGFKVKLSGG